MIWCRYQFLRQWQSLYRPRADFCSPCVMVQCFAPVHICSSGNINQCFERKLR